MTGLEGSEAKGARVPVVGGTLASPLGAEGGAGPCKWKPAGGGQLWVPGIVAPQCTSVLELWQVRLFILFLQLKLQFGHFLPTLPAPL